MNRFPLRGRTLALLAVIIPLLALFIYTGLRSGPLSPIAVTLLTVESREIRPSLFGIGTVEARYTYKIGPTVAGRLSKLNVDVGDQVKAGQILGNMDPIDLDERIRSQESTIRRAQAALREAQARQAYAQAQANRYEELFKTHSTSEETVTAKRQELQIADATLAVADEEIARARADREALIAQSDNLQLIAPVEGMVVTRGADPGTTIVAGQSVVEMIATDSLWVNVRFDQISASGLASGLPAHVLLRSRGGETLAGHVLRVEPMADPITEETLAKVVFDSQLDPMPPIGELAEVTIEQPALAAELVVANAAVQRDGNRVGVWKVVEGGLEFVPVSLGASDLDGYVQVLSGLSHGDRVVLHSEKALTARSSINVVDHIPGATE